MTTRTRADSPTHASTGDVGGRVGLSVYAALIALSAYAGAIGLGSGGLAMGAALDHRLPFHSPVLGGIALAIIVGLPATALAVSAWHGRRRTDRAAVVVGVLLIGWIVVELAFIRELSFLQPLYVGVGISLVLIGTRSSRKAGSASLSSYE